MGIIAFKGFNEDLSCRGFQYEIGKTYELPDGERPRLCKNGFHACFKLSDVFAYYPLDLRNVFVRRLVKNKYCVVELDGFCPDSFFEKIFFPRSGYVLGYGGDSKFCASKITILEEIDTESVQVDERKRLEYLQKTHFKPDINGLWYETDGENGLCGKAFLNELWFQFSRENPPF